MSKTHGPHAKFGTGHRSQLDGGKETRLKPGPGNYMTDESSTKYSAPKFGFGKATRMPDVRSSAPGPGQYREKYATGVSGPRYSMGQTLEWNSHAKEQRLKPGAGNYSPETRFTKKMQSAWKIGSSERQDLAFKKA